MGRLDGMDGSVGSAMQQVGNAARPVKHSFAIAGHKTSISLESAFWDALREAARREGVTLAELVRRIDGSRGGAGLSGAVRVWILSYYMALGAAGPQMRPQAREEASEAG